MRINDYPKILKIKTGTGVFKVRENVSSLYEIQRVSRPKRHETVVVNTCQSSDHFQKGINRRCGDLLINLSKDLQNDNYMYYALSLEHLVVHSEKNRTSEVSEFGTALGRDTYFPHSPITTLSKAG